MDLIRWILLFVSIIFAMVVDNIFWIPTSPEYPTFKTFTIREKIAYILLYRVKTVLTNWRDIIPAIITSGILNLIW